MSANETIQIAPEDRARAELYGFLAALLSAPPTGEFLLILRGLEGDEATAPGRAVSRIATAAATSDPVRIEREYTRLFIGLGRGELLPYASYYQTGNLYDKALAALRGDMRRLGIERAGEVKDPEDNIAAILEMMGGLILGEYGRPQPVRVQKLFFEAHLAPWAERFFAELEEAEGAEFYIGVAQLGQAFMGIEKDAFRLI